MRERRFYTLSINFQKKDPLPPAGEGRVRVL
jgi:hypothetical protein